MYRTKEERKIFEKNYYECLNIALGKEKDADLKAARRKVLEKEIIKRNTIHKIRLYDLDLYNIYNGYNEKLKEDGYVFGFYLPEEHSVMELVTKIKIPVIDLINDDTYGFIFKKNKSKYALSLKGILVESKITEEDIRNLHSYFSLDEGIIKETIKANNVTVKSKKLVK